LHKKRLLIGDNEQDIGETREWKYGIDNDLRHNTGIAGVIQKDFFLEKT